MQSQLLTKEVDTLHLTTSKRSRVFTKYVGSLEVKPRQQTRMSLGFFGVDSPAKGFSIEFSPEPESPESVVTQITALGSPKRHELVLHIANYGDTTIEAEVRQI